jgi:hypothetical protein
MQKTLSRFTCLFFFATSLIWAQSDEDGISVRFSCLAWDTNKANGIQYLDGDEVKELRVSQSYFDDSYTYSGPNPIVFFREKPGIEPGTVVRDPVASAYIKPGLRDLLILFTEATQNVENTDNQLNALVLNNDFGAYPAGSFRIVNLSEHDVGAIFGENPFVIPGKQTEIVTRPVEDGETMRVHFSMKIGNQWEPKINTAWKFHANQRNLIFLTDLLNNREPYLKIKTITDYSKSESDYSQ